MLIQSSIKYKILQGNIPAEICQKRKCIQLYVVPSTRGHNLSLLPLPEFSEILDAQMLQKIQTHQIPRGILN